jgi:hypothetical protein
MIVAQAARHGAALVAKDRTLHVGYSGSIR